VVILVALLACSKTTATELRVATYNLNFANPNVEATLDAIASVNADVLLLQEITAGWESLLRARFGEHYPHLSFHVPEGGAAGHAVLSRHPLAVDEQLSRPPGSFYRGHRLVVTTPRGPLQILHVHLRASIDDDCFRGACSDVDWVKGQLTTPPIRRGEIEAHWRHVDRALPTVVAGDFNEPATGDVVAFLERQGLQRVATTGPPTWRHTRIVDGRPSELLALDIDHVMIDARVVALGATVLDAGASDHRPLVARLRLR
jgi:vancomycin resistance protein VanJ